MPHTHCSKIIVFMVQMVATTTAKRTQSSLLRQRAKTTKSKQISWIGRLNHLSRKVGRQTLDQVCIEVLPLLTNKPLINLEMKL